jgi:hypothetical protein
MMDRAPDYHWITPALSGVIVLMRGPRPKHRPAVGHFWITPAGPKQSVLFLGEALGRSTGY